MHPIFDLVSDGIAKSKAQIALAESEQWDEFTEADKQRQVVLQSINLENITLSEADNEQLHSLMNTLIKLNEQLEQICIKERSHAADELQKMRKGNKVNKAYSQ